MTADDSKVYLIYLSKLVDQHNNTYHFSISKKTIDPDYSDLNEEIETNSKIPKFKVDDGVRITKYKNIFSGGYTEKWSAKIFIINSLLKTNPWTYKIKYKNGGKIIGSFYWKEVLLSKL